MKVKSTNPIRSPARSPVKAANPLPPGQGGGLTFTEQAMRAVNANRTDVGKDVYEATDEDAARLAIGIESRVLRGAGAPVLMAAIGTLYVRSDPAGATSRLYVNTDGGTTWVHIAASG